ncbi:uncharacterized protein BBOV_IV003495 [Babesia bovis T2Bo]|uniref:uncharacterized protein n=1 Tax=Babesia bovis T2Bo TaxID=484906 RepID=UPI001D9D93EF|nr:uncharacterized protein BBOV_IV003495 [Babesia bovis T2Bo]KAG6439891.1 hypothetical protein BBOV_IV003495 [Babesia bovis T2Bo]
MYKVARIALLTIIGLVLQIRQNCNVRAQFCTEAVCQLCCKATQNGCVNAFTSHTKGTLMSDNLYCEQCNCDNPQIGCGWVGRRFKRIECNSCGVIETMLQNNPDLPVAGCGHAVVDGALIYTI